MTIYENGAIHLYRVVGDDAGELSFAPGAVRAALKQHRGAIDVYLNSPGGYVDDGIEIYNALKAHPGRVTVIVDGIAASSASVVAMAGDDVVMRLGASMMVHDPAVTSSGNIADHKRALRFLNHAASRVAEIYAEKTQRSISEIRGLMEAETWFTAREAVAAKFADRVDSTQAAMVACASRVRNFRNTPADVLRQATMATQIYATRRGEAAPANGRLTLAEIYASRRGERTEQQPAAPTFNVAEIYAARRA